MVVRRCRAFASILLLPGLLEETQLAEGVRRGSHFHSGGDRDAEAAEAELVEQFSEPAAELRETASEPEAVAPAPVAMAAAQVAPAGLPSAFAASSLQVIRDDAESLAAVRSQHEQHSQKPREVLPIGAFETAAAPVAPARQSNASTARSQPVPDDATESFAAVRAQVADNRSATQGWHDLDRLREWLPHCAHVEGSNGTGCRTGCKCGWIEQCFLKVDRGADVGVCSISILSLVTLSLLLVGILFLALMYCRKRLQRDLDRKEEQDAMRLSVISSLQAMGARQCAASQEQAREALVILGGSSSKGASRGHADST